MKADKGGLGSASMSSQASAASSSAQPDATQNASRKGSKTSRVSSALKSGVVFGGSAILSGVNAITPHLAGAVDIMIVEQPDGSYKSSPFYVRFGKYTHLRSKDRMVQIFINDELTPLQMHLGEYGQAYFAAEATEELEQAEDEEQAASLLAGMMSPPSGYSSGADEEEGTSSRAGGFSADAVLDSLQQEVQRLQAAGAAAVAEAAGEAAAALAGGSGVTAGEQQQGLLSLAASSALSAALASSMHSGMDESVLPAGDLPQPVGQSARGAEGSSSGPSVGNSPGGPSPGPATVPSSSQPQAQPVQVVGFEEPSTSSSITSASISEAAASARPSAVASTGIAVPISAAGGARTGLETGQGSPGISLLSSSLKAQQDLLHSRGNGHAGPPQPLGSPLSIPPAPQPSEGVPRAASSSSPFKQEQTPQKTSQGPAADAAPGATETCGSGLEAAAGGVLLGLAPVRTATPGAADAPAQDGQVPGDATETASPSQPYQPSQQQQQPMSAPARPQWRRSHSSGVETPGGSPEQGGVAGRRPQGLTGTSVPEGYLGDSEQGPLALASSAAAAAAGAGSGLPPVASPPPKLRGMPPTTLGVDGGVVGGSGAAAVSNHSLQGMELSLCGEQLRAGMSYGEACAAFDAQRVAAHEFAQRGAELVVSPQLVVRLGGSGVICPWSAAAPLVLGLAAFGPSLCTQAQQGQQVQGQQVHLLPPGAPFWAPGPGELPAGPAGAQLLGGSASDTGGGLGLQGGPGGSPTLGGRKGGVGSTASASSWRLWPFGWSSRDRAAAAAAAAGAATSRADSDLMPGAPGSSSAVRGTLPSSSSPLPRHARRLSTPLPGAGDAGASRGGEGGVGLAAGTSGGLEGLASGSLARGSSSGSAPGGVPHPLHHAATTSNLAAISGGGAQGSHGQVPSTRSSTSYRRQQTGSSTVSAAGAGAGAGRSGSMGSSGGGGGGAVHLARKTLSPSPQQLSGLRLRAGQNTIKYKVGSSTELVAYVYFYHWATKLVISDIDGTITRSDVLGHLLPAMGWDWSHAGISRLFTHIGRNAYQLMYLSSRSISQASITRDYLATLVQGEFRMPVGPVIISPHGLLPSLYREMILRRPHEFKIATLRDIRALFPPEWNPFYAGFGNRDTDEISYREVGVPLARTFIINPKGELRKAALAITSSTWSSLAAINELVHDIFPPITRPEPASAVPAPPPSASSAPPPPAAFAAAGGGALASLVPSAQAAGAAAEGGQGDGTAAEEQQQGGGSALVAVGAESGAAAESDSRGLAALTPSQGGGGGVVGGVGSRGGAATTDLALTLGVVAAPEEYNDLNFWQENPGALLWGSDIEELEKLMVVRGPPAAQQLAASSGPYLGNGPGAGSKGGAKSGAADVEAGMEGEEGEEGEYEEGELGPGSFARGRSGSLYGGRVSSDFLSSYNPFA